MRLYEVPARSKADYETLDPDLKAIGAAYTAGLNYFLEKHPQVKPRLIKHFEPWHVVAFDRFTHAVVHVFQVAREETGAGRV